MGTNINIASRLQEFAIRDHIIISNKTTEKICSKGFDLGEFLLDRTTI
ncbi:MAG: hypothetical protein ACRD6Q_09070 [Nitrososphaeraceae archaeon]